MSKSYKSPLVHLSTIEKVGSKLKLKPGESKICNVGSHRVVVSWFKKKTGYNERPTYTAQVVKKDRSLGPSFSSISPSFSIGRAMELSGIKVKIVK